MFQTSSARVSLASASIVLTFYGDIWIGVTVPISIFAALALFACAFPPIVRTLVAPSALLACFFVIICIQAALGRPPAGKQDLVVYLPVVYAGAFIFAFHRVVLAEVTLRRAIMVGGSLSAMMMIIMAVLAPSDQFLVPGQNSWAVAREYEQRRVEEARREQATNQATELPSNPLREIKKVPGHSAVTVNQEHYPAPTAGLERPKNPDNEQLDSPLREFKPNIVTDVDLQFYQIKNLFRNALGRSNYIAVFMAFVGCVALFGGWTLAGFVFLVISVSTMSRFAIIFCLAILAIWAAQRWLNISGRLLAVAMILATFALWVALLLFGEALIGLPGMASLEVRLDYWESTFPLIREWPAFGAPRSFLIEMVGANITWNPHNLVLYVLSLFGLAGLLVYASYVAIVLHSVWRAANSSPLWLGVFVGLTTAYCWSFVEIIALTPAFEILAASLLMLSRNVNASQVFPSAARRQ